MRASYLFESSRQMNEMRLRRRAHGGRQGGNDERSDLGAQMVPTYGTVRGKINK